MSWTVPGAVTWMDLMRGLRGRVGRAPWGWRRGSHRARTSQPSVRAGELEDHRIVAPHEHTRRRPRAPRGSLRDRSRARRSLVPVRSPPRGVPCPRSPSPPAAPPWPLPLVPITGQTLGVILVGAALGSRRGAAALLTYLLVGLAGAPVFAEFSGGPASVLSPSFGFILGFVPAAFVAGWFAERAWDRR